MSSCAVRCLVLLVLFSGSALADPMDLRDSRPRWVAVEFEVSPATEPDQLRAVYSRRVRAWFEPVQERGQVRVTVDAAAVESHLLPDEDPKPGSFSDFVWTFDASTGDVISATLSGTLIRSINWGIARTKLETTIAAEMSSTTVAGFRPPRRLLGQVFHRFCDDQGSSRCTLMAGSRYDFESGYVNAVGELNVTSRAANLRVFSPLGEAVFSEIGVAEDWRVRADADSREFPVHAPYSEVQAVDVATAHRELN